MDSLSSDIKTSFDRLKDLLTEIPEVACLKDLTDLELQGTAALLHGFVSGLENVLKLALRHEQIALPIGENWHKDLLLAAQTGGLISEVTRDRMADYVAFRHFFAHTYGVRLRVERLAPLVEGALGLFLTFRSELANRLWGQEAP